MKNNQQTKSKSIILTILTIMVLVLLGTTLYEIIKQWIAPDISIWESHVSTIAFSTIIAGLISYIITKRKWTREQEFQLEEEKKLAKSEEKFRALTEASPDVIMRFDRSHRHLYVNPALENKLGRKAEEFIGKTHRELDFPEELVKLWEDSIEKVFQTGKSNRTEFQLPNGQWSDWLLFPEFASDGTVNAVITSDRDITRRKKLEQELIKAQKLESLGVLAGGIAHDFNNLLTAIMGNISYILMESKEGTEVWEALTDAEKACQRAQQLTQQLLTFAGGGKPIKKPISLIKPIRDAVTFALTGSNITSVLRIDENLWPVEADLDQIFQIVNNLVINSKQALPANGEVEVEATNIEIKKDEIPELQAGRYIRILVRDCGKGIPKEIQKKIFDPYFTTKKSGSGLGLATVFSIVKNHNGMVFVDSIPDLETTFFIYLPATKTKVLSKEDLKSIIKGSGKILVMDDEPGVLQVADRILTKLGYQAESVKNGEAAIELYRDAMKRQDPFNAVLLDLTVKGGLGEEKTFQQLKMIDPGAKVIVSSGYSDDSILAKYKELGFAGIIPKPYEMVTISEVLAKVITEKQIS